MAKTTSPKPLVPAHVWLGKPVAALDDDGQWLTMAQAIKATGRSRQTLHTWMSRKTVKTKKHGRFVLFSRESIEPLRK